jgi:hypothetical protein
MFIAIYNHPKLEATHMPLNQRMDEQIMTLSYNQILLRVQVWWHTLIIPATQEAEIRIMV